MKDGYVKNLKIISLLFLIPLSSQASILTSLPLKACIQLFPPEKGQEKAYEELVLSQYFKSLDNEEQKLKKLNSDPLSVLLSAEKKVDKSSDSLQLKSIFSNHITNYRSDRTAVIDETGSFYLRFFSPEQIKKNNETFDSKKKASGIYGNEVLKSWKIADDFLTEIPDEKFKITPELILKVVGFYTQTLQPFGQLNKLIPISIPGITPNSNKRFKLLFNSGRSPLTQPLTEDQYIELKKNKWIEGFVEVPFLSKPNARRGVIVYAAPWKVKQKLKELVKWYEENEKTMDPVKLAVNFQRILISIHPLVDGNGRSSRLLMDRILLQKGLPPPIITNHNLDLYARIEDYEQHVREGVALMATAFENNLFTPHYTPGKKLELQVSDTKEFSNSVTKVEKIIADKFKKAKLQKITVQGKHLNFQTDGFLYDQYDVPYVFHEGTLYPIADRSLEYFDMGGERKSFVDIQKISYEENGKIIDHRSEDKGFRKSLSPFKASIYRKNLKFLDLVDYGRLSLEKVKVENFDSIRVQNIKGKPHIYPWQVSDFIRYFSIKAKTPYDALAPTFEFETQFGQILRRSNSHDNLKTEINASLIVSQYQYMDINYRDLMDAAMNHPNLQKVIFNKRNELFTAAKKLLDEALSEYENLASADKDLLQSDYRFNLFYTYYMNTNLRYNSLAEALTKNGDVSSTLLRCSNSNSCKYGYIPATYWRRMIAKIPGLSRIQKTISEYNKMLNDTNLLAQHIEKIKSNKLIPQFLKTKYIYQLTDNLSNLSAMLNNAEGTLYVELGSQVEYSIAGDREYYASKNRAAGHDNDEGGISFSVSPNLYFNGINFARGKKEDGVVTIVRVPKDKFNLSYTSKYKNEYEAIVKEYVSNDHFIKQFNHEDTKRSVDLKKHHHLIKVLNKFVDPTLESIILSETKEETTEPKFKAPQFEQLL